ncbi:MAG: WG repeat-containing protein [Bacteroidia bacterium]
MLSKWLFSILLLLNGFIINAQNLEVFKVKKEGVGYQYGLKDNAVNKVVIQADYKSLYFIGDSSYLLVQNNNAKYGVLSVDGTVKIAIGYEFIHSQNQKLFKAKKNGKMGLIDINGKVLTPFQYDWITYENRAIRVVRKDGMFGAINRNNEIIIPFKYESLSVSGDFFIVTYKGGYGLFDKTGRSLISPVYSRIRSEFYNVFVVENRDKYGIYSPNENELLSLKYSYAGRASKGLITASIGQGYGVLDSSLKVVVPFHFKNPISVYTNILRVDSAGYFGYFTRSGKRLTKIQYFGHQRFIHGWYLLESHRHQALVDITGEHQQRFEYKYINIVDANKAAVQEDEHIWTVRDIRTNEQLNGKTYRYISSFRGNIGFARTQSGYILLMNNQLEELTPALYSWVFLKDNYAEVWIGDKKGVVSHKGLPIVPVLYESIIPQNGFYNCNYKRGREDIYSKNGKKLFDRSYKHIINIGSGKFIVYKKRRWGVLDSNETIVIPFKYKDMRITQTKNLAGKVRDTWYVTDFTGKEVFRYKCDRIGFVDGLYTVQQNNKWGAVNEKGELVIPVEYERISKAEKVGIEVKKDGLFGIYNNKGELLLPVEFKKIEQYVNGYARVLKEGKWAFINSQGKLICEPIYDGAYSFYRGYAVVTKDGKQGLMHSSGTLIIEPKYEMVYYTRITSRLVDVKQDGLFGLMNLKGEWVVEPKFTTIGIDKSSRLVITMLETNGIKQYGALSNKGEEIIPVTYDEIQFDNLRILATKNGVVMQFSLQGECLNCD